MTGPVIISENIRPRDRTGDTTTRINGVPRVAKLMALAIHYEWLLADKVVKNHTDLARLGNVSRARLSQIMTLLHLAPDLQEEVLFLRPTAPVQKSLHLGDLLPIAAILDWPGQRRRWREQGYSTGHCATESTRPKSWRNSRPACLQPI